MGMDLTGAGGEISFNIFAWAKVLDLAQQYGWEPAGTEAPDFEVKDEDGNVDHELSEQLSCRAEDWDGNYSTNDFQSVTEHDAANIADALERALDDIPDFDANEKTKEYTLDDPPANAAARAVLAGTGGPLVGPDDSLDPREFLGGQEKRKVRDFISFCRAGGFLIA
jgi:hypothetical protein